MKHYKRATSLRFRNGFKRVGHAVPMTAA